MNLPRTIINIKNYINNNVEYSWSDDAGFHQYYANIPNIIPMKGTITNFGYINTNMNQRKYSWTDNLGLHEYYADL